MAKFFDILLFVLDEIIDFHVYYMHLQNTKIWDNLRQKYIAIFIIDSNSEYLV